MIISFTLKNPKAESSSIYARIYYDRFEFKYYIAESINPKFWDSKTKRAKQISKFREHPEFNLRLDKISVQIKNVYRDYLDDKKEIPTPEILKSLLDIDFKKVTNKPKTFFDFFQSIIEDSIAGGRVQPQTGKPYSAATIQVYKNTLKRLKTFQEALNNSNEASKKRKIDFNTIDIDFYTDFTEYLSKANNLATNTIGKDIKILKVILNEATERGLNTNIQFKSRKFSTTTEQTDSIYLDDKDLNELEKLDLSKNSRLDNVRDLFLIGCYTGLRFSDFSILTPEQINDGYIEIKEQTKTGNPVVIPVHPTVKRIINKYDGKLPKAISNQKTNLYLKEIGIKIPTLSSSFNKSITKGGFNISQTFEKWELLTTHTARRSFATNEYLNGTPTVTIMAITGHRTEKAFLRYIKLTPKEHATILKQHWENRNQLKAV